LNHVNTSVADGSFLPSDIGAYSVFLIISVMADRKQSKEPKVGEK
jgi:hypothetical protein